MAEPEQGFECSSSTFGTPGSPPSSGNLDSESNYERARVKLKPNDGCQEKDSRRRRNTLEEKQSMNKGRKRKEGRRKK